MSSMHESIAPASSSPAHRSPWHSPVPYLFGGLAAMLGLIAFALLILACSYWKLSGHLENRNEDDRDLESGNIEKSDGTNSAPLPVLEEKYLVIMAGQEKPTCLATPMSSRASSFGSKRTCTSFNSETTLSSEENDFSQVEMSTNMEGREGENQVH